MAFVHILVVATSEGSTGQRCLLTLNNDQITTGKWFVSPPTVMGPDSQGEWKSFPSPQRVFGAVDFREAIPLVIWMLTVAGSSSNFFEGMAGAGQLFIQGFFMPAGDMFWKVLKVSGPAPPNWQTVDISADLGDAGSDSESDASNDTSDVSDSAYA